MSVGMCLILLGIAITQPANKEEFIVLGGVLGHWLVQVNHWLH